MEKKLVREIRNEWNLKGNLYLEVENSLGEEREREMARKRESDATGF